MGKPLNLQMDKCTISVEDGTENPIIDYRPASYTGEYVEVEIGVMTTITLKLDKYMGPSAVPSIKYRKQYNATVLFTEEFSPSTVDAKVYTLTTDFHLCNEVVGTPTMQLTCVGVERFANVKMKLTNCKSNYPSGDYLNTETTFIITCEPGYEFQIEPSVTYGNRYDSYSDFLEKVNDTTYQITKRPVVGWDYVFTAEAIKKSVVIDKYGLITVYRPTKDELKIISTTRWQKRTYEPVTINGTVVLYNANDEYIDTAKYVTSLLKIYAHLDSDSKARLMFGPYDMGIDCDVLGTDIVTLDCGKVNVKGVYGNSIDYDSTDMEAYLPFIGFVQLNTIDFMDKEISLHYQVNVINGDALAVLSADGKIIMTHSCNVSFAVPYQLGGNEFIQNAIVPNTNYLLDEPPFIYVKTHSAVNPDSALPYHDTKFYSVLGALSGYTEATEIDFDTLAPHITKTEIDEIKTLLGSGVFL